MQRTPTPSQRAGTPVPLAVWPVAQVPVAEQRADRYLATTLELADLTPPALAARIVATYSRPGQCVCDVMCGTGTILAEAARTGRAIAGVDVSEPRVRVARVNVAIARLTPDTGPAAAAVALPGGQEIACGDARSITDLVSRADLVVLDPPAPGTRRPAGSAATDLAALRGDAYWAGITEIAGAARAVTVAGGHLVITVRGYQHGHRYIDSAAAAIAAAQRAGWTYVQHIIAVLAPLRGDQIQPPSPTAPGRGLRTRPPASRPPARPAAPWSPARSATPIPRELIHGDVLVFTTGSEGAADE